MSSAERFERVQQFELLWSHHYTRYIYHRLTASRALEWYMEGLNGPASNLARAVGGR